MLNVFTPDLFGMVEMLAAIEKVPYQPGGISRLGIFTSRGVNNKLMSVEEKDGVLRLLPTRMRGDDPSTLGRNLATGRPLVIPHVPVQSFIYPQEVAGVREFGTEDTLLTIESVRDEHLENHANSLDVTEEWHRLGAVRGVVLDADGATEILDLFTFFGVSPVAPISFALASATTADLAADIANVRRTILQELTIATSPAGFIGAVCGDAFYDALIERAEVQGAYERWADRVALTATTSNQPGDFLRESYVYEQFPYKRIMWMNYRGNNNLVPNFIDPDNAHFFPMDVPGLFRSFYAPSERYLDTVNTVGRARFSRAHIDEKGTFIEIYSEMNDIHLCMQPRVLLTGTVT